MSLEILIRYGELALKSPSVRKFMEIKLANNIKTLLIKHNITNLDVILKRAWGRLIIVFDESYPLIDDKIIEKIKTLLITYGIGITSFSVAIKTSSDLSTIKQTAFEIARKKIKPNSSFAVRARRLGKHDYNSKDLERLVGEVIFESLAKKNNLTVNLTQPDYTLFIEVKDEYAYLFDDKVAGFGGLPQGTHGIIAGILRGSIEDALAAFLLAKRGSIIIPMFFQFENEKAKNFESIKEQLNYFEKLQPKKKLKYFNINFNEIIKKIGFDKLKCSLCDEICIKITNELLKQQKFNGITLGNVESAITDRKVITSFSGINQPIYYPLISITKNQIHHPFKANFKSRFCLDKCLGYENEKKKNSMSLSQDEITRIVTDITSSFKSTKMA